MPRTLDEDKMREFALLLVQGNDTSRGKPLGVGAAATAVAISSTTAARWMKSDIVQNTLREAMQQNRLKVQNLAGQYIEDAIGTLVDATTNVLATPTMVNAAKALLQYAVGTQETSEAAGTTINVQVNTELNNNAIEEQRQRYTKPVIEAPQIVAGGFTLVDNN